ncbi:MAG: ABC transporter ATP-binding protein [Lentisphaeria bacterium]
MEIALEVSNLELNINDKLILRDINFSFKKGNWYTIIGHNGSGKTSLLRCLILLHHHWRGNVSVVGKSIQQLSRLHLAQLISYVPQKPPIQLEMTVEEFLALSRYPYHRLKNYQSDRNAIKLAVEAMEIEKFLNRSFHTLSGGEQQRVLIAAALAQETPIIIMDEPGAFLDPSMRFRILKRLRSINLAKKNTIIEVSHDLNTTLRIADNFIALANGQICAYGPIQQLANTKTLELIYQEKFQILNDCYGHSAVLPI